MEAWHCEVADLFFTQIVVREPLPGVCRTLLALEDGSLVLPVNGFPFRNRNRRRRIYLLDPLHLNYSIYSC